MSQEGACKHCETLASLDREVSETAIPPRRSPATPALPRASGQAEDRNTSASLLLWPQRRGLPSCPMAVRDGSTEPPGWKCATIIQHSTRVSTAACCSSGRGMADVRPHPHDVMVHAVLSDVAEATGLLRVICPPPLMPCAT